MSTLKVTSIQATGETASRAVSGVAAAWASVYYSSGTPTSDESVNLSSLSDLGTGQFGANYTNAFVSADKCSTGIANMNTRVICKRMFAQTVSYDEYRVYEISSTPTVDDQNGNIMVTGDLA